MMHKQIEDYFNFAKAPGAFLAKAALQHLPPAQPNETWALAGVQLEDTGRLAIEKPLVDPVLMAAGLQWKGFIDLLWQPYDDTKSIYIYDHKTTKNMSWAKSARELRTDLQLISYAKWASLAFPEVETFKLQHTYMVTSSKDETHAVPVEVSRAHVDEQWPELERRAGEMKALSEAKITWEVATPNWDSCSAFGGCPFRHMCDKKSTASTSNPFASFKAVSAVPTLNGENTMSSPAEMMAALLAKKEGKAPQTAPAPAPAVNTAPTGPVPVLPPDAPVQSKEAVLAAQAATAAALTAEPEKAKKPRASKIKGVDDLTNADPIAGAAAEVAKALPNPVIESPKARAEDLVKDLPKAIGFTLCLHCLPFTGAGKAIALETILHFLQEKIAKQTNVMNIHALDYSQKAKLLTDALKNHTLDADTYTFTTNDGFSESVIMGALANKAHTIIRGVR